MKNYVKLFNFEMGRFLKGYLALVGITVVVQVLGVVIASRSYTNKINKYVYHEGMAIDEFLSQFGDMSMYAIIHSLWIQGPILFCISVLLIYTLLIWYRDWFGKNTFIYRLLMLPTERINIFFAKLTTIMVMVLSLVALQIMLLPVLNKVMSSLVPEAYFMNLSFKEMISGFDVLTILFPFSFSDFMIHYGLGLLAVTLLFTAILFERSFRLKGIVYGILYIALSLLILFSPVIMIAITETSYLYPLELFYLELILCVLVFIMSILTSRFLLNKKITV